MGILIKNTLRSIESNKGQTFVIIITVMVVTAMIFIALSMSDIFFQINMAEYDRVAQGADLLLGENLGGIEFFSEARLKSFVDSGDIESAFYFAKFNTILKTDNESITVLLEATDLSYYLEKRTIEYVAKFDESTQGADIPYLLIGGYSTLIVGESFASTNSLYVGQLVDVYVPTYNKDVKMVVEYIAKNEGIFSSPADKNILVDFSAIGNQGQVNAVYFKFTSKDLYEKYYELFETHFPAVRVDEGNSLTRVKEIVKNNTTLLVLGLAFLVGTMLFILLTAYLVIIRNRVSEMIVFKAIGATQANVFVILLMEVIVYSLAGSAMGLILGRAAIGFAAYTLLPLAHKAISYAFWKYLVAFLLSMVVSVLATSFPIYLTSKKTIRNLMSGSQKHASQVKLPVFVSSSILLILFVVLYIVLPSKYMLIMTPLVLVATVLWAYASISLIAKFVGWLAGKIFSNTGLVSLSGITIQRNRAIRTVILTISIITIFSFLVFQVIDLVNYAVVPYRSRYEADFIVNSSYDGAYTFPEVSEKIMQVDGVKEVGYFNFSTFVVPGTEDRDWNVYGVDKFETIAHCAKKLEGVTKEVWEGTDMAMVLSNDMLLRLNKSIGDTLEINPLNTDYDDDVFEFIIVGVDHTITEFDRVGYCKFNDIKHLKEGAFFLIQSNNELLNSNVFLEIREVIEDLSIKECYALTFHEWAFSQHENLSGVSLLLKILQIVIYLIGVVGILNLSIVTTLDRRNEIKLYKTSGMSRNDYIKFSFSEGFLIASVGGLVGLAVSYAINLIIPIFATVIDKYVSIDYFPNALFIIFGSSVILISSIWMIIALVNKRNDYHSINERLFE